MELREVARRNIKTTRLKQGFSQEALSLQSGLYRTYVGLIERGVHVPTLDTLEKLARTLRVDPRALLDPDPKAKEPPAAQDVNQNRKKPRSPS